MTTAWLVSLAVGLASAAAEAPVAFEFKDAAAHEGRTMVHFRAIELRDAPVQALAGDFKATADTRYGLVPVGPVPEAALAVVWKPKAAAGPELWLDANGDGRLTAEERHVMSGNQIELGASVAVAWQPTPKRVQRTLLFRRSALGDGLRYAVRGYAAGTLDLAGAKHAALLVDGNADGLLDTVGQDRVWIDLDQNGRFDPLAEQFPLGKAVAKAGQIYVISSDATASAVRARLRSGLEGRLRLDLAGKPNPPPVKFSAELVSDLGELAVIDKPGQPTPVPAGDYYVSSLKLELKDPTGRAWSYSFSGRGEKKTHFPVPAGKESAVPLLGSFAMEVSVESGGRPLKPAETFSVRPRLVADAALDLVSCSIDSEGRSLSAERSAEILLLAPNGKVVDRGLSGFS